MLCLDQVFRADLDITQWGAVHGRFRYFDLSPFM
jgi:hypothetical protein